VGLQDRGDLITEALWLFGPEAYERRNKLPGAERGGTGEPGLS
jgi:hypothetical protein